MNIKIEELLSALNRKEKKKIRPLECWQSLVAAVAGIAFAVYHFFAPRLSGRF